MDDPFDALVADVRRRAAALESAEQIETLRTEVLGRRGGSMSALMAGLAKVPKDERAEYGRRANAAKEAIEAALGAAADRIARAALDEDLRRRHDLTFPGIQPDTGSLHPLRQALDDVVEFFRCRGFAIVTGPLVESEYYNFEALNIPPDHPARDAIDTFYLEGGGLLRPHTSPVQLRAMLAHPPPIAILAPGMVFRRDALDARHAYNFHQIEGLHVDRGIAFGHLKGFVTDLCRHLFGADRRTRFRPSYFQFTEPSAEVDVSCGVCGGAGCRTCGGAGWLELGGSGMVHPHVLRSASVDPDEFSGWAFGLGLERLAMLRAGMDDIRSFTENDPAFLEQFA